MKKANSLQLASARIAARQRRHELQRTNAWAEVTMARRPSAPLVNSPLLEPTDVYLAKTGCMSDGRLLPLDVSVDGHVEKDGCTMYLLCCKLGHAEADGRPAASWSCQKRLCDIREVLHDHVKDALGAAYHHRFGESPFARHGGLPGTTTRLQAWFKALATCMNEGILEANLCAYVLRFLVTPKSKEEPGPVDVSNSQTERFKC
eukprot:gnl/TRDRNA2_/TRDRNA2_136280_c0_seq3.p1 gnl/TRDRNA2_/TRDRNA2_136280_c0~~gnl/TRDRNA2_/TRDRNA2_136280_c0_seq3.p1  ORF type:complete len:204 (-),score=34.83 gnl/TRDRNA2_/TRDRNA2_136280_c0_seq3:56-667(-)